MAVRKKKITQSKVDRLDALIDDIRDAMNDQRWDSHEVRMWLNRFNRDGNSIQSQLRDLIS